MKHPSYIRLLFQTRFFKRILYRLHPILQARPDGFHAQLRQQNIAQCKHLTPWSFSLSLSFSYSSATQRENFLSEELLYANNTAAKNRQRIQTHLDVACTPAFFSLSLKGALRKARGGKHAQGFASRVLYMLSSQETHERAVYTHVCA